MECIIFNLMSDRFDFFSLTIGHIVRNRIQALPIPLFRDFVRLPNQT